MQPCRKGNLCGSCGFVRILADGLVLTFDSRLGHLLNRRKFCSREPANAPCAVLRQCELRPLSVAASIQGREESQETTIRAAAFLQSLTLS